MKVLIACEESQEVCKAFRAKGHEAYSCDIQVCSGCHPEWHIMGDVLRLINGCAEFETMDGQKHFIYGKWDLLIAHPPCTYMSKAGARWMYPKAGQLDKDRFQKALAAKEFFMKFLNANCDHIAIENPVPLKCVGLPKYNQKIQPYEFDVDNKHPYSKQTLLWLKNLPPLVKTTPFEKPVSSWTPSNTGGFSRGFGGCKGLAHDSKIRSKTFMGIAAAMADQWG